MSNVVTDMNTGELLSLLWKTGMCGNDKKRKQKRHDTKKDAKKKKKKASLLLGLFVLLLSWARGQEWSGAEWWSSKEHGSREEIRKRVKQEWDSALSKILQIKQMGWAKVRL